MYRPTAFNGRILVITTTFLLLRVVPQALSFTSLCFSALGRTPCSHNNIVPQQSRRSVCMAMSEQQDSGDDSPKNVVIAGAGVIGISTAYYLVEKFGIQVTLVDPTGQIAPAASGKAGGFLALDWNDMSPM